LHKNKRERVLKAFDRPMEIMDKSIEKTVRKYFIGQEKRILNGFKIITEEKASKRDSDKKSKQIVEDLTNWELEEQLLFNDMVPEYLKGSALGVEVSNDLFGFGLDDQKIKGIMDERIVKWINTEGAGQVKHITDSTQKELQRVISSGLQEGETNVMIAERIQGIMTTNKTSRSVTIARTESHNTIMNANFTTMDAAGVKKTKWVTARDISVRGNKPKDVANHIILDGQIREIGKPFSNGLLYPGDANGNVSELVNCRCIAVVSDF